MSAEIHPSDVVELLDFDGTRRTIVVHHVFPTMGDGVPAILGLDAEAEAMRWGYEAQVVSVNGVPV